MHLVHETKPTPSSPDWSSSCLQPTSSVVYDKEIYYIEWVFSKASTLQAMLSVMVQEWWPRAQSFKLIHYFHKRHKYVLTIVLWSSFESMFLASWICK
jgi:hypothetical protein